MNRGEKITFAIGLIMALIDMVIGVVSMSLLSNHPDVALDIQGVFLWGFALCLAYLTIFVVVFVIRNR